MRSWFGNPFYGTETQLIFTVTYGCPYLDDVQVWPLPVVDPWMEDWWEMDPVHGDVLA